MQIGTLKSISLIQRLSCAAWPLGIDWLYDDINASLFNIDEVQKDMLFQSINTASFHGDYFGSESSFAVLHSDRNDVTHSHLDCGSFVYDAEGVRFASDMGQDNYNLYNYWQTSSKIKKTDGAITE